MPTAAGHTKAIRASRVLGTSVHTTSGEEIGKVEDVILDKTTSRIMFAVVSVGGVVTTSATYHALPWAVLDYDEDKGGYVVACSRQQIAEGPSDSIVSELARDDGEAPRAAAYSHYGIARDW